MKRGGAIGPFRYHPPLPDNASRWRRTLRGIYDTLNTLLYWSLPWR